MISLTLNKSILNNILVVIESITQTCNSSYVENKNDNILPAIKWLLIYVYINVNINACLRMYCSADTLALSHLRL